MSLSFSSWGSERLSDFPPVCSLGPVCHSHNLPRPPAPAMAPACSQNELTPQNLISRGLENNPMNEGKASPRDLQSGRFPCTCHVRMGRSNCPLWPVCSALSLSGYLRRQDGRKQGTTQRPTSLSSSAPAKAKGKPSADGRNFRHWCGSQRARDW